MFIYSNFIKTLIAAFLFLTIVLKANANDEYFLTIATGYKQPIAKAPSVATIITASDIRDMGALDIDDVLETIPGLHVARTAGAYNPIYTIRGIFSEFNQQVLMLINGIPITNLYNGDRGVTWGGMPVHSIARIEVIRGPGSALYGADAYAGVINIITKNYDSLETNEIGMRGGSFNTKELWWLQKAAFGDLKAAFTLEWLTSDGDDRIVDNDLQTFFDNTFGSTASLAPSGVNTQRDLIDARLDLSYHDFQLRAGYQGRYNVGTGAGNASALDDHGEQEVDRINIDINYNKSITPNLELSGQLSYFHIDDRTEFYLFPENSIVSFGGPPNFFPNGVIGQPSTKERHYRARFDASYSGIDNHKLVSGVGYTYSDLYFTKEKKNFDSQGNPLGDLIDVSDDPNLVFLFPEERKLFYAFIQDEWNFAQDWDLTAGLRYDNYSDFGHTINPRAALVWQMSYEMTGKLMYGRAFRAPAFTEEFLINNPVAIGDKNIDPEVIDTIELAFSYQNTTGVNFGVNLFAYQMEDIIRFDFKQGSTVRVAQNTGKQLGYGLETEIDWEINDQLEISANYAYQRSIDKETNEDAGNAPEHQLYLKGKWNFSNHWQLVGQINSVFERKRVFNDNRKEIDDYTVVDLTLRYGDRYDPWSIAVTAKNLFNADIREPSVAPGFISNDLPMPGRGIFAEINFRY